MAGLAAVERQAVLAARQRVFPVEQQCAFQGADGHDLHAWRLLARTDAGAAPALAGCLRVLDPGRKHAEPSIARVLTVPSHRGIGRERTLMIEGIKRTRGIRPARPIRVAAQQRLETFYASLGLPPVSAPYDEDGILHVDMQIDAAAP